MLWEFKGCGYVMGIYGVWLCYGYLRCVVMLWVFLGVWLCYGYLRYVVMLQVFKGCGYVMGI